jgi:hypothetical protein
MDAEPSHETPAMIVDGAFAQTKFFRNLFCGQAIGNEHEHQPLAGR